MIEVSVITPTYNRQDSLRRLLDSLAIQTLETNKYEVIVVDDGSSSGSIDENFEGYLFQFQYLRQENQGATIARNYGALKSQGQVLVFIDDDVTISANVLETLTKVCTMDPKVIALGWLDTCNTKSESTFTKVAVSLDNKDLNRFKVKDGKENFIECNTQLIAIRRDDFFELGMFQDPTGGWPNWDDVDLGYRAHLAGYQFIRVGEAMGKHWDNSLSDMESTSQRWFRASKSAVQLFKKYPELQSSLRMYEDKTPVIWGKDTPGLVVRKSLRGLASSKVIIELMEGVVNPIEKYYPNPKLLLPMYRWIFGAYMYQGYQQGLREYDIVSPGT
ncbi:glycosyltransferase family 2 protein [Chloroflexota bacterium]